jgi:hypothetical protein
MPPVQRIRFLGLAGCYLPFGLCLAVGIDTVQAWWLSWFGSWFIFYMVFSGRCFDLASGGKLSGQILRPWFLMHTVYAGYGFITSIFYWMDLHGWYYFNPKDHSPADTGELSLAAQAQVYYGLAHAALVTGLALARPSCPDRVSSFTLKRSVPEVVIKGSFLVATLSFLLTFLPGVEQFATKLASLGIVAGALSAGLCIREKSARWLPMALILNVTLFLYSLVGGWKEATFVLIILNAIAFFPLAPTLTTMLTTLVFIAGFVVLPSISNSIRTHTWRADVKKSDASALAINELLAKTRSELGLETWGFLTGRLSEQSLFVKYLQFTPNHAPFQRFTIVKQSFFNLIPRIAWPQKPITERLVMARVYENGVVGESSNVSAKPQFVVDGYLTRGALGVWLSGIVYGFLAQMFSRQCEEWLGGYLFGGIFFNGLFAIMWRGNCWEFYLNTVLWSFFLVCVLRIFGRAVGWLKPASSAVPKPLLRSSGRSKASSSSHAFNS